MLALNLIYGSKRGPGASGDYSVLVKLMAFRLLGTKPFPEPMLSYCEMDRQLCLSLSVLNEGAVIHS